MTKKSRAPLLVLGIAAVAGILAGAVAVYVRGAADGNAALAVDCAGAMAAAERAAPFAKGEVAAFQVMKAPASFAALPFKDPAGKPTTLGALDSRFKLVNLWATWCIPCREEMPALDRLEGLLGSDTFSVVAVNVDVRNEERAREFLEEIGIKNLAFYADPALATFNELKGRGIAFGLPTSILVDGKGCGIGVMSGPAAWDSEDALALIRAATS